MRSSDRESISRAEGVHATPMLQKMDFLYNSDSVYILKFSMLLSFLHRRLRGRLACFASSCPRCSQFFLKMTAIDTEFQSTQYISELIVKSKRIMYNFQLFFVPFFCLRRARR